MILFFCDYFIFYQDSVFIFFVCRKQNVLSIEMIKKAKKEWTEKLEKNN